MASGTSKITAISVFLISFAAFFTGFLFNAFKVLEDGKYLDQQGESLVIGRMVKSRTDGIFSSGGLCGRCAEKSSEVHIFDYQYVAYLEEIPCISYQPYLSQIGFHAAVYSFFDKISPFAPGTNLRLLRAFKSGTLAMVMSLVVLWFLLESGLISAIFVALGILLTPWFTFLGKDLWFCIWTNFLPFMLALHLLRKEHLRQRPSGFIILLMTNLTILVNFIFNGYEWVSTTLIMATIPFFYYWRKAEWPWRKLAGRLSWLAAGSLASIAITFSILIYQISLVKGKFSDGIDWIIFSFLKRSHGDPDALPEVYAKQVDHPIWEVFLRYFSGTAFRFPAFITGVMPWFLDRVFFAELFLLFLATSILVHHKKNPLKIHPARITMLADLSVAAWISLLAPFSWYVIFKGHAWSHYHINYITWFMPYCLFGLALVGATIASMVEGRRKKENFSR